MRDNEWRRTLFYSKLKELHPTIKSLSPYISGLDPMDFQCKLCKHKWKARPSYTVGQRKTGCPECKIKSVTDKSRATRSTTQVQNVQKMLEKSMTKLIGRKDNMRFFLQCGLCNKEWDAHINSIRQYVSGGCTSCALKKAMEPKTLKAIEEINKARKDLEIIAYSGNSIVECSCVECSSTWKTNIRVLKAGCGCPTCGTRSSNHSNMRIAKTIKVGGKEFKVVGYEHYALLHMVKEMKIKPKHITEKTKPIPYTFEKRNRNYIPDFFIESTNTFVEVKSEYTLGLTKETFGKTNVLRETKAKAKACKKAGYNHILLLVWKRHPKSNPIVIKMPENWTDFPATKVKVKTLEHLQHIISSKIDCINVTASRL